MVEINRKITSHEMEALIMNDYLQTGDYKELYRRYAEFAKNIWADSSRKDYEADIWYNKNRNEICLEMLGDMCQGKKCLSVGGAFWIEKEFVDALEAEVIRTDIIPNEEEGVIEADASSLPFENESFDFVFCRDVIEHVLDEQLVFAEINRVLKPDGYLLLTTPNAYTVSLNGVVHVRAYSPFSLINELENQGYRITQKRGNVPYIWVSLFLMVQQGFNFALDEFKQIDKLTKHLEERYYLSTQLFVLAQKGER